MSHLFAFKYNLEGGIHILVPVVSLRYGVPFLLVGRLQTVSTAKVYRLQAAAVHEGSVADFLQAVGQGDFLNAHALEARGGDFLDALARRSSKTLVVFWQNI